MPPDSSRERALFDEIVAQHGAALARLAGAYERDHASRDELMQEILLALWRALPGFRGDASLRTWMYRVAHNVATTHVVRDRRRQARDVANPEPEPTHDGAVDETERLAMLHDAIQRLAPLDRQIVLLYLEEIPQAEIAAITGITIANVSTRVGRIKERLARTMTTRRPS